MEIRREEVLYVAGLAHLELSEAEVETFTRQLDSILRHFQRLRELDLGGVEPMSHVIPLTVPLRPDEVRSSLSQEEALMNAPLKEEGTFVVPRVVEGG